MRAHDHRVLLRNISWETYERLLAESVENCGTRFAYDQGNLEILVASIGHEVPNRTLASLAGIVAEETERDFLAAGSTTLLRNDVRKGFEPDSCFYLQHAAAIRGKSEIDLAMDPPPELIIEVDLSNSSLNRFPIYAAIGVLEIWRYDGERVRFHLLQGQLVPADRGEPGACSHDCGTSNHLCREWPYRDGERLAAGGAGMDSRQAMMVDPKP